MGPNFLFQLGIVPALLIILSYYIISLFVSQTPYLPIPKHGGLVLVIGGGNIFGEAAAISIAQETSYRTVAVVKTENQAEILRSKGLERLDPFLDVDSSTLGDELNTRTHVSELDGRIQSYAASNIPLVAVVLVLGPTDSGSNNSYPIQIAKEIYDSLNTFQYLLPQVIAKDMRIILVPQSNIWFDETGGDKSSAKEIVHRMFLSGISGLTNQAGKEMKAYDVILSTVYTPSATQNSSRNFLSRIYDYVSSCTVAKYFIKKASGVHVTGSFKKSIIDALTSKSPKKVYNQP